LSFGVKLMVGFRKASVLDHAAKQSRSASANPEADIIAIPDFDTMTKEQAADELYFSEQKFINTALTPIHLFQERMKAFQSLNKTVIDPNEIIIFRDFQTIYEFHKAMLEEFQKFRLQGSFKFIQNLGAVMIKFIPFFKMYSNYVPNTKSLTEDLNKVSASSECKLELELFEIMTSYTLKELLNLPCLRFGQYLNYLAAINKQCDPNALFSQKLLQASEEIRAVLDLITTKMEDAKKKKEVYKLQHVFFYDSVMLVTPSRQLVRKGKFEVAVRKLDKKSRKFSKAKPRQMAVFLFNDCLLFAKMNSDTTGKPKHVLRLAGLSVDPSSSRQHGLGLEDTYDEDHPRIEVFFNDAKGQFVWLEDLRVHRDQELEKARSPTIETSEDFFKGVLGKAPAAGKEKKMIPRPERTASICRSSVIGQANIDLYSCAVLVEEGLNLLPSDLNGFSDPYVKIFLQDSQQSFQTSIQKKTLDPVWQDEFVFDSVSLHDVFKFEVFDHDLLSSDDPLGNAKQPFSSLLEKRAMTQSNSVQQRMALDTQGYLVVSFEITKVVSSGKRSSVVGQHSFFPAAAERKHDSQALETLTEEGEVPGAEMEEHECWERVLDETTGCYYYANRKTWETTWERPVGYQYTDEDMFNGAAEPASEAEVLQLLATAQFDHQPPGEDEVCSLCFRPPPSHTPAITSAATASTVPSPASPAIPAAPLLASSAPAAPTLAPPAPPAPAAPPQAPGPPLAPAAPPLAVPNPPSAPSLPSAASISRPGVSAPVRPPVNHLPSGQASLLSSIRQGATLRKASPVKRAVPQDSHGGLMNAIRGGGVKLKKVTPSQQKAAQDEPTGLQGALQKSLAQYRKVVAVDEEDDSDSDDWD